MEQTQTPPKIRKQRFSYICSNCGKEYTRETRDELATMHVVFKEMNEGCKTIRTRVLKWLCKEPCMAEEELYNRPAYVAAGGYAGTTHGKGDKP